MVLHQIRFDTVQRQAAGDNVQTWPAGRFYSVFRIITLTKVKREQSILGMDV